MARASERLPENVAGDFFVDATCIDCDTCRQLAPETFARSDVRGMSFVHAQPSGGDAVLRAALALVACPTSSIGSASKARLREAANAFPIPIAPDLPDVLYCGYASEKSFGASSYLVLRKDGNVLVDSPRAAGPLLDRIEALGGVRFLFLSHRDDVADHEAIRERFGCERILHEDDVTAGTRGVERKLSGRETARLAPDLLAIPVPGHTRGSAALLYRDEVLFTGDHLAWDRDSRQLDAMRGVCWWSPDEQTRSLERLLAHRFRWVLPGHGDRHGAATAEALHEELARLVAGLRVAG